MLFLFSYRNVSGGGELVFKEIYMITADVIAGHMLSDAWNSLPNTGERGKRI